MLTVAQAHDLARSLLAEPLLRRWEHTLGVARQARGLAPILGADCPLIEMAALLHDVGYAKEAVDTGQHMIDGARYLRDHTTAGPELCSLVAYHTSSRWEAHTRGLEAALTEFPPPPEELLDALTWCDLTVGPEGRLVAPAQRLAEVLARYGPGHIVFEAVSVAQPELLALVARVERRLAQTYKPSAQVRLGRPSESVSQAEPRAGGDVE
jgi:putative nucleotidyltransferase with HDIG domain